MKRAMPLNHNPNLTDPDSFYTALVDAHATLTDAESQALNARLVLVLANHIGDLTVLKEAIETAQEAVGRSA
jgi:hypothetical protein